MSQINENKLAQKVAAAEGLKQSLSIAQIKEVQSLLLQELHEEWTSGNEVGVVQLITKLRPTK